MTIKKVNPGDTAISAGSWNEMRDFVNNYAIPQDTMRKGGKNPFLITVKNSTSGALSPLSIVRIASATYDRSGDTFVNKGLEFGTELNGTAPVSEDDNVAILQGACPSDGVVKGIASGCSPCKVLVEQANKSYSYAKPVSGQTGYLKATDDTTNIRILWHKTGAANSQQPAYVCLDASKGGDNRDYFIINKGNSQDTDTQINDPRVYTKGSLHYIVRDGDDWIPSNENETSSQTAPYTRPANSKLVVCQEDAPVGSNRECKLHYFAPEDNYGVPPLYSSSYSSNSGDRCGVKPGEHRFTDKMVDYIRVTPTSYVYNPVFMVYAQAYGQTGGNNTVYVSMVGQECECFVPNFNSGISGPGYPDIWPYDEILVEYNSLTNTATAIDYPRDYPEGTVMPWYLPGSWVSPGLYLPGRGWEKIEPHASAHGEITAEYVDPNGSHYDSTAGGVWVENGTNDKALVRQGCLMFVQKVKTNAII